MEQNFIQEHHTEHRNNKNKGLNPFLLVPISFAVVILIGSVLLYFPFSQKALSWSHWGDWKNYIDCLFTAVSCTCVTGLNVFKNGIGEDLTFFGQLVCLIMIQIGGLGFITVLAFFITLFRRKIRFRNRYFLQQAVNSTSFGNVISFVRKIILISFSTELLGTLLLLPVFHHAFPDNVGMMVWASIFHSVSSFCNAGFDIMGSTSLIDSAGSWAANLPHWAYVYLCIVTMLLIVFGGISFLVILEVFSFKKPKQYRVFTKIVLLTTAILLVGGSLFFILFECFKGENSMTVLDAVFQSVTCRTAGFATYDQTDLSVASRIASCFLMFIGGSPLSTAGGIKTTTVFMVVLAVFSYVTGREVNAFKRKYSVNMVVKAMALIAVSGFVIAVCYVGLNAIESMNTAYYEAAELDRAASLFFETISAFGTVGLSMNVTTELLWGSKLVLCVLMFIGRLGPMALFNIFQNNINIESKKHFAYVEEDFLIG